MAESAQYSRSVIGASDEIKNIYCEPCSKGGLVALAEGYCKNCPEYLCAQCYRSHRRNKILASHVLLDIDSMPITPGSIRVVLDICKEKCTIHSDKVIEFFCETCDTLGCTVCITLDHRQCGKVKHIPDVAKDFKNNPEFLEFQECFKSTINKLTEFEQKIQANASSNNEMQKRAKQELKRQRAAINKLFDELEKKMDDNILTLAKRNKDTLKSASDRLEPMKKDLDQIKNDIKAKKTGQNCELFITMKKSKDKMRTFDDQFSKMQGKLLIQHYTLLPSEQIEAMMRNTAEICKISIPRTTTEISKIQTPRTTAEISRTPTAKPTTEISRTPTARFESVIDITTNKDKTKLSVCSLIVMHGHYCVVADDGIKSIKVVDTKRKQVTSEIGIEAEYIWGVTSMSDDQIVVSVLLSDMTQQIQFFSVSTSGVIKSTNQLYYVDDYYLDMVLCKGNIYGVHCGKIDILNMTGKIIRTIRTDDKGAALFNSLQGIAHSPDGQTIYVTDGGKNSVTSLTFDDKVKAVYTDKDLQEPWGITVDKHGYVYVRSRGTDNVQQLTADLHKVQVLIEDVVGNYITYSKTENKLYLSDKGKINEYSINYQKTNKKLVS